MTRMRISWVVVQTAGGLFVAARADSPLARSAAVKKPHPTLVHAMNDAQALNAKRER
jgi:hypothetical protein